MMTLVGQSWLRDVRRMIYKMLLRENDGSSTTRNETIASTYQKHKET